MNIWSEMMTAIRSGVNEVGESVVEAKAIRVLEQEINESNVYVQSIKEKLANNLVQSKKIYQQLQELDAGVKKFEDYANKALQSDNEKLALEVAEKIVSLEAHKAELEEQKQIHEAVCEDFRQELRQSEHAIYRLKQQVDTVKATTCVQRAQEVLATRNEEDKSIQLQTAIDSLKRLKSRKSIKQEVDDDTEINISDTFVMIDAELQKKLKDAGILASDEDKAALSEADRVLARIKAKQDLKER